MIDWELIIKYTSRVSVLSVGNTLSLLNRCSLSTTLSQNEIMSADTRTAALYLLPRTLQKILSTRLTSCCLFDFLFAYFAALNLRADDTVVCLVASTDTSALGTGSPLTYVLQLHQTIASITFEKEYTHFEKKSNDIKMKRLPRMTINKKERKKEQLPKKHSSAAWRLSLRPGPSGEIDKWKWIVAPCYKTRCPCCES